MKKNCRNAIALFLLCVLTNCADNNRKEAVRLEIPLYRMINYSNDLTSLILTQEKRLVFTFDGNCGHCTRKLQQCDSLYQAERAEHGNLNCFAILNTRDKFILEYHLEKLALSIPVFIDTGSFFLSENNITGNNIGFILDSDGKVIYRGDYLKSQQKFIRVIKKIDNRYR